MKCCAITVLVLGAVLAATPATAQTTGGDARVLKTGDVLVHGDVSLVFQQTGSQGAVDKELSLAFKPVVEGMLTSWLSLGGFLAVTYMHFWDTSDGQSHDGGSGIFEIGPRLAFWLGSFSVFHPYLAAKIGYSRFVIPGGPDGNGFVVGPELGIAVEPIPGVLAFVSIGYEYHWWHIPSQGPDSRGTFDYKLHQMPVSFGIGAKF